MADVLSFQKRSMKYFTYFTKTKLMDYKTKNADTILSPREKKNKKEKNQTNKQPDNTECIFIHNLEHDSCHGST